MGIKFKRQGGGSTNYNSATAPTSLKYGEPAVDSAGTLYIGDGSGAVRKVGPQLYTGTFTVGGWVSIRDYFTQTQNVTPVGGGAPIKATAMLGSPQSTQTDDRAKNKAKQKALGFFALGKCTPGEGTVTIKCWNKPTCDVDVFWEAR